MRRWLLLVCCGLAAIVGVVPAAAYDESCPRGDGTVPGTSSSVTRVGTGDATPYTTIYVDDREFTDLDGDDDAAGLWIYLESNGIAGLQRGARVHFIEEFIPRIPRVEPIPILPPNPGGLPVLPRGLTLFPNGFGGGSVSEIEPYDWCGTDEAGNWHSGPPDSALF